MPEKTIQLPQVGQTPVGEGGAGCASAHVTGSARRQWWFAAAGVAAVASAFCLILAVVLVRELLRDARENPLAAARLTAIDDRINAAEKAVKDMEAADEEPPAAQMQAKYAALESLRAEYRHADEQIRKEFFERRRFMTFGGWMLLGGAIVLAISLKTAFKLAEEPPALGPMDMSRAQPARAASFARWAVVGCAVAAAATLGLVVFVPGTTPLPKVATDRSVRPTTDRSVGPTTTRPVTEDMLAKNWIGFRGYMGIGVAAPRAVLTDWDGPSGKNILWKMPVPLPGNNSPIIFEDRLFMTGSDGLKREVYCFDANTGKPIWTKLVSKTEKPVPDEEIVNKGTGWAPATMATDGNRVMAMFPTGELVALDIEGNELWRKQYDVADNSYGHASSLLVWNNRLIVQLDIGKTTKTIKSCILALDTTTGNEIWKTPRPVIQSWASPIVAKTPSGVQIIAAGNPWIAAYDPASGKEIWKYKGFGGELAPSPGYANGLVYMGVETSDLLAIRTDLKGDVNASAVVWKTSEAYLPDIVSILATDDFVFSIKGGRIVCLDAKTGPKNDEPVWDCDVSEIDFKASPILVGDTVFVLDTDGVMHMFKVNEKVTLTKVGGKDVSTSRKAKLGEGCLATPAFANGRIYLRGEKNLYCIGTK